MKDQKNNQKKPQNEAGVKFIAIITLKLTLICAVAAALLALVNYFTAPVIAENEMNKKVEALKQIFPEMVEYAPVNADEIEGVNELYVAMTKEDYLGYCANVSPNGFGGAVNLMIGIDKLGNVAGVNVISNTETAGYGELALKDAYLSNYTGLGGEELVLGVDVDAYAGATVTSKAINRGINSALAAKGAVEASGLAEVNAEITEPEIVPEPVVPEIKENVFSIEDAQFELYAWIDGWNVDAPIECESEIFNEIYLLKEHDIYNGYALRARLTAESGSADVLIATHHWPKNQIIGIAFIDYEGEGFKALAADKEYLQKYKGVSASIAYEGDLVHETLSNEAQALCEAISKTIEFYPEYEVIKNSPIEEKVVAAGE